MEEEPKKKVQIIAPSYYSRLDVQNAIYNFCKNRETVPRYLEGFGKRPDVLDYPSDIFALVKKGATSFHCSEELWNNPLDINTDMTPEQYNEIKKGWDFLIDIDSKYLDYSKIAADLIVKALEFNGVENIGIKFSGSKGFHLIVPWEAFPEEVNGEKTKDNFPEWPRLVAGYIDEIIHDKLVQEIFKMSNKDDLKGKMVYEVICRSTGELAIEKKMSKYICRNCRANMDSTTKSSRKVLKCPSCGYDMDLISSDSFYVCPSTNVSSKIKPEEFEKRATARDLIDSVDIVLVASRHLFRAPYSLHEKTALASVVVDKNDVKNFQPIYADPLKVQIKDFHPTPRKDEAKELLLQALDWAKRKNKIEKKFEGKALDLKGLTISEDMFPEVIKKIMNGMKGDGRKRALSVLVSFLTSLDFPQEYIEEKIDDWNKKNYKPLKEGYIRSQIVWGMKHKRLPPNYDKPVYKELGVLSETSGVKNPINFTIREAMRAKGRKERKGNAK